jgi:hypothetical protein
MTESLGLLPLVMPRNGKACFPTLKEFVKEHIPFMFAMTLDCHVVPTSA